MPTILQHSVTFLDRKNLPSTWFRIKPYFVPKKLCFATTNLKYSRSLSVFIRSDALVRIHREVIHPWPVMSEADRQLTVGISACRPSADCSLYTGATQRIRQGRKGGGDKIRALIFIVHRFETRVLFT